MLAAPIGRLVMRISGIIGSFCRLPLAPAWSAGCSRVSSLAFVASVPGKSRQSLFFGLCGFGFFELRGIGRSPGHPFGMPPERVWPVQ